MHSITGAGLHDRPVFVLAQHRSGGTLLARLLNCHPGLVIWGEHAGFINRLAEAHDLLMRHHELLPDRTQRQVRREAARGELSQTDFHPWRAPFAARDFAAACRVLVRDLFSRGVLSEQRWGFKEIRYHSPLLATFLRQLFPASRFIVLDRDPVELCVSDMLVTWGRDRLVEDGVDRDHARFVQAVEDCLYAILAVRRNLALSATELVGQSHLLRYEVLAASPVAALGRAFRFIGLPAADAAIEGAVRATAACISGSTDKAEGASGEVRGLLTPDSVRRAATAMLPQVSAQIECEGLDLKRLRREPSRDPERGRYSWLLGDHGVAETALSTMF
ncbi:MAG: sulfotransferase [Acetobacteraceae bacterium]